jgi:hypothetical protein
MPGFASTYPGAGEAGIIDCAGSLPFRRPGLAAKIYHPKKEDL